MGRKCKAKNVDAQAKDLLQQLGIQLDAGVYPRVKNGGLSCPTNHPDLMPVRAIWRYSMQSNDEKQKHDGHKDGQGQTGHGDHGNHGRPDQDHGRPVKPHRSSAQLSVLPSLRK